MKLYCLESDFFGCDKGPFEVENKEFFVQESMPFLEMVSQELDESLDSISSKFKNSLVEELCVWSEGSNEAGLFYNKNKELL